MKGQITACGFVTMYYHIVTRGVVEVKGQITACGFVTRIHLAAKFECGL